MWMLEDEAGWQGHLQIPNFQWTEAVSWPWIFDLMPLYSEKGLSLLFEEYFVVTHNVYDRVCSSVQKNLKFSSVFSTWHFRFCFSPRAIHWKWTPPNYCTVLGTARYTTGAFLSRYVCDSRSPVVFRGKPLLKFVVILNIKISLSSQPL